MSKKLILVAGLVAAALFFVIVPKLSSTADATHGDCYSGDKGPDTPTICQ